MQVSSFLLICSKTLQAGALRAPWQRGNAAARTNEYLGVASVPIPGVFAPDNDGAAVLERQRQKEALQVRLVTKHVTWV